jgi:arachidonate 15-lipoxygenase
VARLPQHDPDSDARRAALGTARDAYRYDRSYHGLLFVESLPRSERFGARYLSKGAAITAALAANRAAVAADDLRHGGEGPYPTLFATLPPPLVTRATDADLALGWARIAGPNPALLRRLDPLPEHLPLTDDDLGGERGALHAAVSAGRIYGVDYACFDGVQLGQVDGRPKYLLPTAAAFEATPTGLRPLAIQPEGVRGDADSLVRPHQGDRWRLASLALSVADENFQGVVAHMGWCHLVAQRFLLATHRCLAPQHPLYELLVPHFEYTLAVNQVARTSVLDPGGTQDRVLAPALDEQIRILKAHVARVDLPSLDPTVDHARRGVDDTEALPVYPFRDDELLHWRAHGPFVTEYVQRCYPTDADVVGDEELQSFLPEIAAADAGGLPGLVAGQQLHTRDDVVALLRRVLHRCTAFHGAINDGNYDWAAYAPCMPTAAFAPLTSDQPPTGAELVERLPPRDIQLQTLSATYNVLQLKVNRLGHYPAFSDPGITPLVEALQGRLQTVESTIARRNRDRWLPYKLLLPSRMTLSISA